MRLKKSKSFELLIIVNLLPLFGVFFLNWSAITVILIYFLETFIVGIMNILKMAHPHQRKMKTTLNKRTNTASGQWSLILFFVFLKPKGSLSYILSNFFTYDVIAEIGLISFYHFYSYLKNYIGMKEFKKTHLGILFIAPYKRILIQHLFVMIAGFFILSMSDSSSNRVIALILFIVIKSILDIRAHTISHTKVKS
jgi:hypothetical protein